MGGELAGECIDLLVGRSFVGLEMVQPGAHILERLFMTVA